MTEGSCTDTFANVMAAWPPLLEPVPPDEELELDDDEEDEPPPPPQAVSSEASARSGSRVRVRIIARACPFPRAAPMGKPIGWDIGLSESSTRTSGEAPLRGPGTRATHCARSFPLAPSNGCRVGASVEPLSRPHGRENVPHGGPRK